MRYFIAALLVLVAANSAQADLTGLSKVLATQQQAGEQESPINVVHKGLRLLELEKSDVMLDPGCGSGLTLAMSVKDYGCRSLGIEIDVNQADLARRTVRQSDVEKRALILLGDFTKYDFTELGATKAYVYLYPEALAEIAPELKKLKRVVSYMHDVPGLKATKVGDFYVYDRDKPVATPKPAVVAEAKPASPQATAQVTKTVEARRYAVYGGKTYYSEYNPGCGCDMCRSIRYQLTIPRTATVVVQESKPVEKKHVEVSQLPQVKLEQPTGRWWYGCMNGTCGWHWVK